MISYFSNLWRGLIQKFKVVHFEYQLFVLTRGTDDPKKREKIIRKPFTDSYAHMLQLAELVKSIRIRIGNKDFSKCAILCLIRDMLNRKCVELDIYVCETENNRLILKMEETEAMMQVHCFLCSLRKLRSKCKFSIFITSRRNLC